MSFRIEILPRANHDVQEIYDWIVQRSPDGASNWYGAYASAIQGLSEHPSRCFLAAESPVSGREIRQLIFRTAIDFPYSKG